MSSLSDFIGGAQQQSSAEIGDGVLLQSDRVKVITDNKTFLKTGNVLPAILYPDYPVVNPIGTMWVPFTHTSLTIIHTSIAYGNGVYIRAGLATASNVYGYSLDGVIWQVRNLPVNIIWKTVTYVNGLFIINSASSVNNILTSPDGITWTQRTLPSAAIWSAPAYINGLYVIFQNTSNCATSEDCITWTSRSLSAIIGSSSISDGNTLLVVCNNLAGIGVTTDGINWTKYTLPDSAGNKFALYHNGLFIVATTTNVIYTSIDCITWTKYLIPTISTIINCIVGNGVFIFYSATQTATTTDFINWDIVNPVTPNIVHMCYSPNKFVAFFNTTSGCYSEPLIGTFASSSNLYFRIA